MMNIVVSIVIPAFNAEKTIKKCLCSCFHQSYRLFEIIVINDGSTDNTLNVCKSLQVEFDKLKIVNKQNGGLLSVRKEALNHAVGDYLFFLDPDDYLEPNAIELLINNSNGADVVIGDIILENEKGSYISHTYNQFKYLPNSLSGQYCNYLSKSVMPSLCGRLIRRTIFAVDIDHSYTTGEDNIINFDIVHKCNGNLKITLVNHNIYHYVQYPVTMVNNKSEKALKARIALMKWVVNFFLELSRVDRDIYFCLNKYIVSEYFLYLREGGRRSSLDPEFDALVMQSIEWNNIADMPIWRKLILLVNKYMPNFSPILNNSFYKIRYLIRH